MCSNNILDCGAVSYSGLPSLKGCFHPPLLEAAEEVWRAHVRQTGRISRLHEEISRALWGLGILHRSQSITADGLFCLDITLDDTSVRSPFHCSLRQLTLGMPPTQIGSNAQVLELVALEAK